MADTSLFVFGDSLSDTGNSLQFTGFIPPPPYFNGRFSNGPVAVEILAAQPNSGLTLDPTNNFAFGGATTGRGNSNEDDLGVDLPGLLDEIAAFAARVGPGGADPTGLYIVWAGPNNFLDPLGGTILADPAVLLQQGTSDLVSAVQTLQGLGAEKIVLPNMVNLGRLPASRSFSREATAISKAFNASVALAIGNLSSEVTSVDLFSTGEAIAANPASFGLSNVTDPLILQLIPTPPPNASEFFFWDPFHPTTQGHAIFANTIAQTLSGAIPQPIFNLIRGSEQFDLRFGTDANDDMDGLGGSDWLIGAAGDDRIEGWSGNDQLFGGLGADVLSGGDGNDLIWGDEGADIGFGGQGNDWLLGYRDDDILVGDQGEDTIDGGQGNDYLLGGGDDDLIWGGSGEDILNGGGGADRVWGGLGADRLDGGTESDQLTGGGGNDQFVYRFGNGSDRIIDFVRGEDQLDLTSFDFTGFADFIASVSLDRNRISFGEGNVLRLVGVNASSLSAADLLLA